MFDKTVKKGHVFTFGICRDAYKKVFIKAAPPADPAVPGPGTYNVRETPGKDAIKFTMRPKTPTAGEAPRNVKTPGPGTYDALAGITPKGTQFFSRFQSSRACLFHPPRSRRFNDIRIFFRFLLKTITASKLAKDLRNSPGPGHYPASPSLNEKGRYFNSKFKGSMCRTFGSETRDFLRRLMIRPTTPGPGAYQMPSDFFTTSAKSIGAAALDCMSKTFTAGKLKRTRSITLLSTAATSRSQKSPVNSRKEF